MAKGLPRSLSRGSPALQDIVKRQIRVDGLVVNVAAAGVGVGFGTAVIEGLPEGNILLLGAVANLQLAGSGADANLGDTWNGDFAIGTAPDADGALAGAEVDVVPSTAVGPAVAEVSPITRGANGTPAMLDNTDASMELNLNVLVDAADIVDASNVDLTVTGSVHLVYVVLGDD